MTSDGDWRDIFVGRDAELAQLQLCWEAARKGEPQLAVLLAPPGMGKTRLVQQFYHHLSQTHDGAGEAGYWPDRLGRERDRIAISCRADECDARRPMNMLWWAIKFVDAGSNGAASSDLLIAWKEYLEPHLDVRRTDAQLKLLRTEQFKEAARGLGEGLIAGVEKAAELIPVIGPFVGLGKALGMTIVDKAQKMRRLEQQRDALEADRFDLAGKVEAAQEDFEEQLMRGLAEVAAPRSGSALPPCPTILVVDDAQFADQEPALASFLRRLIDTAWAEKWSLMVILTHWTREWNERIDDVTKLPGLIKATTDRGLMQNAVMPLGRIDGLQQIVRTALPGLPADQEAALVEKASGNARYMERLIQLLQGSPAMFVAREVGGAIHADALAEIMQESFDLHDVTRRLYDSAPEDARRAAALASIQGERFLYELVDGMAERMGQKPLADGLRFCEYPLAVVGSVGPGVGEFSQGVFREVARFLVPRLVDRDTVVLGTLGDMLTERLDRWKVDRDLQVAADPVAKALLLDLAIGLGQQYGALADWALLGRRAALRKGELLASLGDMGGAGAIFDALGAEQPGAMDRLVDLPVEEQLIVAQWLHAIGQIGEARDAAMAVADRADRALKGNDDPARRCDSAKAQMAVGQYLVALDEHAAARSHYQHCLDGFRRLADEDPGFDRRRDLSVALNIWGNLLWRLEGAQAAKQPFEECLRVWQSMADDGNAAARPGLGLAAGQLGDLLLSTDGAAPARSYLELFHREMERWAAENGQLVARDNYRRALGALGNVVRKLDGGAAARPYFETCARVARELAVELRTPAAVRGHGIAQAWLGIAIKEVDGPAASRPYYVEAADIFRALNDAVGTPQTLDGHAISEEVLGDLISGLDGAEQALPHYQANVRAREQLAAQLKTPSALHKYAVALNALAWATDAAQGREAALPYFESGAVILAELAEAHGGARSWFVSAVSMGHYAETVRQVRGAAAAMPLYLRTQRANERSAAYPEGQQARDAREEIARRLKEIEDEIAALCGDVPPEA